jgi:hypothetical protein
MITVKGLRVCFKGKDAANMRKIAASLGLSEQTALTGLLWEHVMWLARQGVFKKAKKAAK